jgi:hypothetical protein
VLICVELLMDWVFMALQPRPLRAALGRPPSSEQLDLSLAGRLRILKGIVLPMAMAFGILGAICADIALCLPRVLPG